MAHLLVLKGLNPKQRIWLDKDRILIGRHEHCDIVLPANDFALSGEHARILRVDGKFFIEDMGSRNGTYVNNELVTERRPLHDNDLNDLPRPRRRRGPAFPNGGSVGSSDAFGGKFDRC